MKLLLAVIGLALCGMAQSRQPNDVIITAERIKAACSKVRKLFTPCYPTRAIPKPKACSTEMDLLQKSVPVMEVFGQLMEAAHNDWNKFNTEPARDFVEAVESWEKPCYSTTMDGLPNCPMPKMTSEECLTAYPPDRVGGFCDWYGYATPQEEDRFEKKRGLKRKEPYDRGSVAIWVKR